MTPQTLLIDRTFKGVGRIKRATGTTVPKVRAALSNMLTALHQQGRLDILRAIRDGKLEMLQVYDAYRRHALDTLPLAGTLASLKDAMGKWIEDMDASDSHRRDCRTSLNYFIGVKPNAVVNDLPEILEGLRNTLGKKHPRSFNIARSHASGFVRQTLKRNHPLWGAVTAVEKREVKNPRKGNPLTPTQVRNFFPNPETDGVDEIAWSMVTTGMHQKELWGAWHILADRIHIDGTKRNPRVRDIPLVRVPSVPRMHRRTFEDKMRERFTAIQPYDLRRTFSHWMELAGIPRTRRKLYMGHGVKDVTDLYERHEVESFLKEDAEKLRTYLNFPHTKVHTMTLEKAEGA